MTRQRNLLRSLGVGISLLWCGCATNRPAIESLLRSKKDCQLLELYYRTDTDRLNVAAAANQSLTSLPACSIGTVKIRYPHPSGTTEWGQATVSFQAAGNQSAVLPRSVLSEMLAHFKDESKDTTASEVWLLDLPESQIDTIVARLENSNFFNKRIRVPHPEIFLAARIDKRGAVGKNYNAVTELDALVLRVRQEGQLVSSSRSAAHPTSWAQSQTRSGPVALIARLPAVGTSDIFPK